MSVADGLEARVFAAEPMVRQPVAVEFDDRGRLWVIQYLQYPNPSGLNRVQVDRYSRTVYDRVPEPPPRGPKGSDRVTILEDTDRDGRADRARDFVSGLNLASGLAFGYGGVFILQTPYLLFYPDRDRDDRPDRDPDVLLEGFGIEDAHSVANSLTWGPDGWLYGLQGSTVTARVRGVEFQQGVWRYHPISRRFELFCEGGGNMWGLDFDRAGNLFASTNVGGFVMLHGVQGGYYWKSFGKHGPLHNPHTYGYFDHVRHDGVRGGHVTVGGLFYEADAFPDAWRGRYIAADLLGHEVHWHEVHRRGSTFRARQGGDLLRANDTWFAPTDMTLGPDGALYITDWHDKRTAHPDPDADWDRSNGRIFAVSARGARPAPTPDLAALSDGELVALLGHPNTWYRRKARRLLAERRAVGVSDGLRRTALEGRGVEALEAFWAHYGCVGFDEDLAHRLMGHPDADVRAWAVRLSGDEPAVSPRVAARLVAMAGSEPDVTVRSQLACTAQRLAPGVGLEVADRLLVRDLDLDDPHLPHLLWWAVERHALAAIDDTLARFTRPEAWQSKTTRTAILGRLIRRFAQVRSETADSACARLLASAPTDDALRTLMAALDEGTLGRRAESVAQPLVHAVDAAAARDSADVSTTRMAARLGSRLALDRARAMAADRAASETDRLEMLDLLNEIKDRGSVPALLDLATRVDSAAVRSAAMRALGRFEDDSIASALLAVYPRQDEAWRSRARELLLSRASWARAFLTAVDHGEVPAEGVTIDQLGRVGSLGEPSLEALVRKRWGMNRGATPEEKLAEVRRLNNDLRAAPGDPARGRLVFRERCASCHRLHGEGEQIGPDLTFANRKDRDFLLVSLVDPSGVVRKEFQSYTVQTNDGRVLTGLIVEQAPDSVTLRDAKGERTTIARAEVEDLKESAASLMPESLYRDIAPDQLRDLFGYLQSEQPRVERERP
jgi:putative membrane-bound dehydrogenase-like protein